jgi:hypothetical protein
MPPDSSPGPENAPSGNAPESEPKGANAAAPNFGPGSRFKGVKGRSGAKKGNQNSTRHGMKGSKLPPGCGFIENRVNALRRQVEDAVLAVKGVISLLDAATINSILKHERHGLLAAHWLRKEASSLSAGDRLRFSAEVCKASDNRDKNIRALGLDRDAGEVIFQRLYSSPVALPDPSLPVGERSSAPIPAVPEPNIGSEPAPASGEPAEPDERASQ